MGGDWQQLAEPITARRAELRLSQIDVRQAGGPSTSTQKTLERSEATTYRPSTLVDLELVLRWQPGSVAAVLAGGDPIPAGADPDAPRTVVEHVAQLRDEIARFRRDFERQRRAVPRVAGRRRRPRT